ncbi:MAG: LPS export ABC transporter ATP-binding protein [bacterium]
MNNENRPEKKNNLSLRVSGLIKDYGKKRAVNGVDIEVKRGDIVGLLGPNGAGKTTIFYSVMGIIAPTAGKIFLGDADISGMPVYRRAREGIGYLAQEPSIFRGLSARENLSAVAQFTGADKKERIDGIMEEMGISSCAGTKASNLSGGEKRRVEISRILLTNPSFLLLDEPFVGIDPIAVSELKRIVTGFKKRNIGVLITDHNVRETLKIIDSAYIIHKGKILIHGTSSQLLNSSEARKIYLGEDF